jgi:hypothetical protein
MAELKDIWRRRCQKSAEAEEDIMHLSVPWKTPMKLLDDERLKVMKSR